jgi:hypothetical protein
VPIRYRRIVSGQFCGLRPGTFQFGHAGEGRKAEYELFQVVAEPHVREFVFERDVQFVGAQKRNRRL